MKTRKGCIRGRSVRSHDMSSFLKPSNTSFWPGLVSAPKWNQQIKYHCCDFNLIKLSLSHIIFWMAIFYRVWELAAGKVHESEMASW